MIASNKTAMPEVNMKNKFDALCQEFAGGYFYGLEYILEDFFQTSTKISTAPDHPEFDWFGLYE